MKRRNLTVIICLLAICALISVGFSAWVITNDAGKDLDGTVSVDVVKDARIGMSVNFVDNGKIVFGAKNSTSAQEGWLKYEQSKDESGGLLDLDEKLTIQLHLEIGNYSYLDDTAAITLTFEEDGGTHYAAALEKGYVAELPNRVLTKAELIDEETDVLSNVVYDEAADTVKCDITITFAWGTTFGGQNPIDFYNGQAYTDDLGDEAFETLEDLNKVLNNGSINYKLKIEAKTKE